jgi:hypothetical protein
MCETLIIAPLVLVPAIVLSLQQAIDPVCSLAPEIPEILWADFEPSPFIEFHNAMLRQIAEAFSIRTLTPSDLYHMYAAKVPSNAWALIHFDVTGRFDGGSSE